MKGQPPTGRVMPGGIRKSVSIPGLLAPTAKKRCREFGDGAFASYAVALVCYDLRSNASHTVTLEIARDTQAAQDAVDHELVTRYKPGQPRPGLLVQIAQSKHLQIVAARSRHDLPLAQMSSVGEHLTFPAEIWPHADERWQSLGYRSLSASSLASSAATCSSADLTPTRPAIVARKCNAPSPGKRSRHAARAENGKFFQTTGEAEGNRGGWWTGEQSSE